MLWYGGYCWNTLWLFCTLELLKCKGKREEELLTKAPFTYYRSIVALCDSLIVMATSQRQQGGVHLSQVERLLSYEQLLIVINNEKKYSDIIQQLWTSISNHLLSFIKEVSVCVCGYYECIITTRLAKLKTVMPLRFLWVLINQIIILWERYFSFRFILYWKK